MRPAVLALLASLTACGSEQPAPPLPKPDSGVDVPADIDVPCGGACGAGTACVAGRCEVVAADVPPPIDTSDDRATSPDAMDVARTDITSDAGSDTSDANDAPPFIPDIPTPTDDAGNLLCGMNPGGVTCISDNDCARCIPRFEGNPWCCYSEAPGVRAICLASSRPCVALRADAGR